MSSGDQLVAEGLDSLEAEIRELVGCFQEVLSSDAASHLAVRLPWLGTGEPVDDFSGETLAEIYSIAFQLLDICEEQVAGRTRVQRERTVGPGAEKGLWVHCFESLKNSGVSEEAILDALRQVRVEPVFTAHPTEVKRPSVRERHRDLYDAISRFHAPGLTDDQKVSRQEKVYLAIEALWHTGEIHVEKPTIEKELRNVLYYLREVFPKTLRTVNRRLAYAWDRAGLDVGKLKSGRAGGPRLRFGLWIGGDRDGHPFVTADLTRSTLGELRNQAVKLYRREIAEAAHHLTVSTPAREVPPGLDERIRSLVELLGEEGQEVIERNPEEPWRCFGYLLRAALNSDGYGAPEFESDLSLYHESLASIHAPRLADEYIRPIQLCLETFGFHLADLDIRQNSAFHDKAVAQLLEAAGIEEGGRFAEWDEERRVAFLNRELESTRPFLAPKQSAGPEADTVRDCYRVLAEHWKEHGTGLGALIISMTRQLSDLLVIQLFARETGLVRASGGGWVCPLQVVPLFETLDDLRRGADIVDAYLAHPVAKRYFSQSTGSPSQQIMLGYSDSNKDGGILASQWALHHAQATIAEAGKNHGVSIRFFHGRGGTISRGAGPNNWFLRALPHGSLGGDFRMTEQGETIARKYAYPDNAAYHIESLMASVTHSTAMHAREGEFGDPGTGVMGKLAEWSEETYRAFLSREGFIDFYRQATVIDALEQVQIGSRPSRRTGTASLDDLRAIPWVFSWTQSRFFLPGWYGTGTALERLFKDSPEEFEHFAEVIPRSVFPRYVFTNVETNLVSADLELMRQYASLVGDDRIREGFMVLVESEFERSRDYLGRLFPLSLEERRPRFAKTLELRETPLRTLHLQQVEMLRRWRESGDDIPKELVVSISAIASGLRTTG